MALRRDSANLLQALNVLDYRTLQANGQPTPVTGATAHAQVYDTDRITPIGPEVTLTAEVGSNDYRGVLPADTDLSGVERVAVRTEVDAGGLSALVVRWSEEAVID